MKDRQQRPGHACKSTLNKIPAVGLDGWQASFCGLRERGEDLHGYPETLNAEATTISIDVNEICTTLFKVEKDVMQKEWSRLQLPASDPRCATRRLFEMRCFASPSVTTSVLSGSL